MSKRMAESEGFEPSIQLPIYLLSREALSTTQPTLRMKEDYNTTTNLY